MEEGYLESPFSLVQARVHELAHRSQPTATEISRELGLDTGYLSRILRGFERTGLVEKRPAARDGRRKLLSLTARGREAFAPLDTRSRAETEAMLTISPGRAGPADRGHGGIMTLLDDEADGAATYLFGRTGRRHGLGRAAARRPLRGGVWFGDEMFEALVAEIVAGFIRHFDPERERCWIVERDGENVGSSS